MQQPGPLSRRASDVGPLPVKLEAMQLPRTASEMLPRVGAQHSAAQQLRGTTSSPVVSGMCRITCMMDVVDVKPFSIRCMMLTGQMHCVNSAESPALDSL